MNAYSHIDLPQSKPRKPYRDELGRYAKPPTRIEYSSFLEDPEDPDAGVQLAGILICLMLVALFSLLVWGLWS